MKTKEERQKIGVRISSDSLTEIRECLYKERNSGGFHEAIVKLRSIEQVLNSLEDVIEAGLHKGVHLPSADAPSLADTTFEKDVYLDEELMHTIYYMIQEMKEKIYEKGEEYSKILNDKDEGEEVFIDEREKDELKEEE